MSWFSNTNKPIILVNLFLRNMDNMYFVVFKKKNCYIIAIFLLKILSRKRQIVQYINLEKCHIFILNLARFVEKKKEKIMYYLKAR